MLIQHYDLEVVLDYDRRGFVRYYSVYGGNLVVKGSLELVNENCQPEDRLIFGLYRLFNVRSVQCQGQNLAYESQVLSLADYRRLQFNKVTVQLPRSLAQGETCQIDIEYEGPLCGYIEAYPYVKDHISERFSLLRAETMWYPCATIREDNMQMSYATWPEFTYRLRFKVPLEQVVAAKGRLVERTVSAEVAEYVWENCEPGVMISAAVAPYRIAQFDQLKIYCFPEHQPLTQQVGECVDFTLGWCRKHLGEPIRRSKVVLVEVPEGYGSWVDGIIFQTADAFRLNEGSLAERVRCFGYISHEVAHLWSVFSSEEQSSRFLDESLTHYVEALIVGERFGRDYYFKRLEDYRTGLVQGGEQALKHGILAGRERGDLVTVLSRCKGPLALAVLHCLLKDKFLTVLHDFTQRHARCLACPEDLLNAWRQQAQFDFDLFIHHWFMQDLPAEFLTLSIEQIAQHYQD